MRYGARSSVWQRIIASPVTMVVGAIVLAILAKATWNIYEKADGSSARLASAQAELARARDREGELSAAVGRLSTEQGIEAEIRTRYHAVKEGESVAVIIDDDKARVSAGIPDASVALATTSMPWWRRFLHLFGI